MDAVILPEHVHSRTVAGDALCRRQSSPECGSAPVHCVRGRWGKNPTRGPHLSVSHPQPRVAQAPGAFSCLQGVFSRGWRIFSRLLL
uniref:Predicted protein n=1 Tax=Hordeum vulgare subsp. vulgare TaxID=112509 RepID=F2DBF6_HORVV|nr:predicted protein [Hordeum vulgare subsp. vulgare]